MTCDLDLLGATDVGRMDLGKHPAYDSKRPYVTGDIVSYGGEVWRCLKNVYPVAFGAPKGAKISDEVKEWIAKGDGEVHAPSNSDSHWENITDRNEGDFASSTAPAAAAYASPSYYAGDDGLPAPAVAAIAVGFTVGIAGLIVTLLRPR